MSGSLHNSVVALEFVQMCLELFVRHRSATKRFYTLGICQPRNCRRLDQHFMFKLLSLAQLQNQNKKTWLRLRRAALENAHISNHSQFFFNPNLVCGEKVVSKFGELRDRRERKLALGWKVKARRKRHLRSWLNLQHLRY